jgi:hypothetical protein
VLRGVLFAEDRNRARRLTGHGGEGR